MLDKLSVAFLIRLSIFILGRKISQGAEHPSGDIV